MRKKGKAKPGPKKRIPEDWRRRSYFLSAEALHGLGVLAKMADLSESEYLDRLLRDHVRRSPYGRRKK